MKRALAVLVFAAAFLPCAQAATAGMSSLAAAEAATVETFVSPDSSFSAMSAFIGSANESLRIATYTFGSPEIASMLMSKASLGVSVMVIADKSPAGGMSDEEKDIICTLAQNGVSVLLYDGTAPYMHAKYAVRDDASVLVSSENIGASGYHPQGTYGNRGWGAAVHDASVAGEFSEVFDSDFAVSAAPECTGEGYDYNGSGAVRAGAYTPSFATSSYDDQDVSAVFSPDSLDEILALIASANETIDLEQLYIYTHWGSPSRDTVESAPSPLLEALIAKARQGVRVRILMDSSYYNVEEDGSTSNYHTARLASCIAEEEGIPLEAGLIDIDGKGLAALHNKGVIIDGSVVLVSSINWNENSVMRNREAGIVISGEAASYYALIFEYDWPLAQKVSCSGAKSRIQPEVPGPPGDASLSWAAIAAAAFLVLTVFLIYLAKRKY